MKRHYTKRNATLQDRIRQSVKIQSNGCWNWTRTKNAEGYGQIRIGGKMVYSHRAAYEAFIGPIPDGLTLDHICKNTSCANPKHLEPVTMRENLMRGTGASAVNANKTECKYGHPLSGENLYVRPNGARTCRRCNADAATRLKIKTKGAA